MAMSSLSREPSISTGFGSGVLSEHCSGTMPPTTGMLYIVYRGRGKKKMGHPLPKWVSKAKGANANITAMENEQIYTVYRGEERRMSVVVVADDWCRAWHSVFGIDLLKVSELSKKRSAV